MRQKCQRPGGDRGAKALLCDVTAKHRPPDAEVNSGALLDPDPLYRRQGEHVADWMRRWRDAGLLDPWPACLPLGGLPMPLAVGIRDQLLERLNTAVCAPQRFSRLFSSYCHQPAYLTALARQGPQRHGVDDQPVGPVAPKHQQHARERLEKRRHRKETETRAAAMATLRRANGAKPTLRLKRAG